MSRLCTGTSEMQSLMQPVPCLQALLRAGQFAESRMEAATLVRVKPGNTFLTVSLDGDDDVITRFGC
jgi:hypothetical protein